MSNKPPLPIGNDNFRSIRDDNFYYVDKTLMIQDFIMSKDKISLITRPRRFGKTLNMTMIREFFDITKDSRNIFNGLAIMDTEYANQLNSRPVVYFTFKDCRESTAAKLQNRIKTKIYQEYLRYEKIFRDKLDKNALEIQDFYAMIDVLRSTGNENDKLPDSIYLLTQFVYERYGIKPILLIDEYDAPIITSYEYHFHSDLGDFFSNLYGSAMKGNDALEQALLTGVQRVAKESIFSQFNNATVYTVLDEQYAPYFGLTTSETKKLLSDYGLILDDSIVKKYNGYRFGKIEIYNPWSILNYVDRGVLKNYWINTSSNTMIKEILKNASKDFWNVFDQLASGAEIPVWLTLETAYMERTDMDSLWGLLVNSGYITALEAINDKTALIKIPNDEVMSEFQSMVVHLAGIRGTNLEQMFHALLKKDMQQFISIYQQIVTDCTSYMDAKENAYHMLMLGMCITLRDEYKVTSNLESGYGRYDITLEALNSTNSHVVIEFKQGEKVDKLKQQALKQIIDNKYYTGLKGEIICVGLAHYGKKCEMAYKIIHI